MKTRVVILASQHPHDDKRVFIREARSLAQAGYEVHLIARANRSRTEDGVFIHALPSGIGYLARAARLMSLYKIGLRLQGDIIHCHEVDSCVAAIMLKRRLRNTRVIFDVHEDYVGRVWDRLKVQVGRDRIFRKMVAVPYAKLLSQVDAVIAVSELMRDEMLKYHPNVTVVMNAMNRKGKGSVRDSGKPLVLGHVGEMDESRGLSTVMKAIHFVSERSIPVHLVVFGARVSKNEILASGKRHRVEDKVSVRDVLPYRDLMVVLGQLHVGIVAITDVRANNRFALPAKLFDCLAAGLPVIGSEIGCIGTVLRQSGAGLTFSPGDAMALAERIAFLANNEKERQKFSMAAMVAADGEFSWRAQNEKMLNLYEKMRICSKYCN